MTSEEQLDVLDLAISTLLEHERRLDTLVRALEAYVKMLYKEKGYSDKRIATMIAYYAPLGR